MPAQPWGRDFVNRRYAKATAANEAEGKQVKAGGTKRRKTILSGPYDGDPLAIDWMACGCGYQPPTSRGKPVPQYADPAYALWVEGTPRGAGKQSLHKAIKELVKDTYRGLLGYHHNTVPLGTDPGFPDLTLWGRGEPCIMYREEKAMKGGFEQGQREHLLSLRQRDLDVRVWKPCCYLSGLIDLELAMLAGVAPRGRGAQRLQGTLNKTMTWDDVAAGALDEQN